MSTSLRVLLRRGLRLVLTFSACGIWQSVVAQSTITPAQLKLMSVEELMDLPVHSVSLRPESWREAPANVFVLRPENWRSSGSTSIPQLLRLAPSLFVAQSGSFNWGINARGFVRTNSQSNKLLVLVDGRSIYSPFFSNVYWDAADFFLPDLVSVEVISGPAGTTWGSNAVNGVINITSKSSFETLGTTMRALWGHNESVVAVRQGVKLGEAGALRVYAKQRWLGATLAANGTEDGLDDGESTQAGFRADWGTIETGTFTAQGDVYKASYDNGILDDVEVDGANLMLRWERGSTVSSYTRAHLWYDYSMRNTSNLLTQTSRALDFEFQHRRDIDPERQLVWGAGYRHMWDQMRESVGFVILPESLKFGLGSAFAQYVAPFVVPDVRVTAGLRLEHNHFSKWEVQPNLRMAWIRPKHTAWVAASRATRIPSRLERGFFAPNQPPFFIAGGPGFRAEVLHALEAGWRAQPLRGTGWSATAYVHDYKYLRTVEPSTPIIQANLGRGRSYGVEFGLDQDITPEWRVRIGGFWMEQDTWLEPGSLDVERSRGANSFPGHQVYVRSAYEISSNLQVWCQLRHIAAVPAFESGVSGRIPAYAELDARLAWNLRPNVEMAIIGRNLLDRSHPEIGNDATRREIERTIQFSIRYEFQ